MGRRILKTGSISIVAAVVGACVYLVLSCWWHDLEREEITDSVRQAASGRFAHLSDGFTHYEIAGVGSSRTVVLIHGVSVPYYLWDKTFDPLARAGFCVLRYDLYGRGLSDRPNEHYNADLYDRQLSELLTSLGVHTPVDLVGASMGGPIAVTFAARHPEKVRTLSLFDPDYRAGNLVVWPIQAPLLGECLARGYIVPSLPDGQTRDFMHPERSPDYFQRYLEQMRFKGFRRAILSTIRDYLTSMCVLISARSAKAVYQSFCCGASWTEQLCLRSVSRFYKTSRSWSFMPLKAQRMWVFMKIRKS